MKSFRLISMQIADENNLTDIDFQEGLIINKEDESGTWLMEVFVEEKYVKHFEQACSDHTDVIVQVVITKKENDPAAFRSQVCKVKRINGYASILLKGHLTKIQNDYPALLLEHLLEQGLAGDELLKEFKEKITARPRILLPKKV
ncbi:YwpF-like family protein [Mesobacillus maritimus]|uniref:YwpF-like family protein n=1 Tax=Mesobacillus maritimus TaxID=1643336 RepID=UPI00203BB70B|nr:YwpF-like family protein [Mesobacillus maritimus]MCM3586912.1 YwpF-like family protein [Mesobacillus maritimus]MCM3668733.1 YwpF-like family protein [Mesobacillus maritimus]